MAVEPTHDNDDALPARDDVFQLAAGASDEEEQQQRRTITMYRNGFVVDDGPYRRLEDVENAEFLKSLAMGRTPRELLQDDGNNVTVNLVDQRTQDYVETFRSFSGAGTSLGATHTNDAHVNGGIMDPATSLPSPPPQVDMNKPTTSIQVKLLNGTRKVIQVNTTATVATLGSMLEATERFRFVTGFPPQPLTNLEATIEEAGLKGAQVMMQKA